MHPRRDPLGVTLIVLLTVGHACTSDTNRAGAAEGQQMAMPALELEWKFEHDSTEQSLVTGLLNAVTSQADGPRPGASGVLYRFDGVGEQRYLLLTYLPGLAQDGDPTAVLYVLQSRDPQVSPPLTVGRWALGSFGPFEISDLDGDGGLDVAFCRWPQDESESGEVASYGYVGREWYEIEEPEPTAPDCNVHSPA